MTYMQVHPPTPKPASRWGNPVLRFIGSFSSWLFFSLSFTLLVVGMLSVLAVGGTCASGGPYEIATPCPSGSPFAILGAVAGLVGVVVGTLLAQGFGAPLFKLAFTLLFCGLGYFFLMAFLLSGDMTGLIMGVVFEVMGIVPFIIGLAVYRQQFLIGAVNINGVPFYDRSSAERPLPPGVMPRPAKPTVRAGLGHWALSLVIAVVASTMGYYLAQQLAATIQ